MALKMLSMRAHARPRLEGLPSFLSVLPHFCVGGSGVASSRRDRGWLTELTGSGGAGAGGVPCSPALFLPSRPTCWEGVCCTDCHQLDGPQGVERQPSRKPEGLLGRDMAAGPHGTL